MMFCVGFLFQFLIAGLTGIMLSVAPFDWQLGNSYFVVAHFHYVLVGAILFTLFAAFYYWYPEDHGPHDVGDAGQVALLAVSHRLPSHLRLHACSRPARACRAAIYTYEAGRGWGIWNMIVSIGAVFQAVGHSAASSTTWCIRYFKGKDGRPRSMGCVDAGMVHDFAAARL